MNRKIKWVLICLVLIILFIISFSIRSHADVYKGINAECQINNSYKDCDQGLICVPFNEKSGNGKCKPIIPTPTTHCTPTPEVSPTASISATPTATPSATDTPSNNGGSQGGTGVSDGRHQPPDGLGCAVHDCSPKKAPNTGRAE